ncbi:MAG: hypothetical protein RL230_2948 [Pseudomonadota bacterium]
MIEGDLIIHGAQLADGSGQYAYAADILIAGDRIIDIGVSKAWAAKEVLEAHGLTACPGFIDAHSHDDRELIEDPAMIPKISQGVTTVVVGNCGLSLAPLTQKTLPSPLHDLVGASKFRDFAAFLDAIDQSQPATNVAALVGHTSLRVEAMSDLSRTASPEEMEAMRRLCLDALAAGAIGVSSGLYYPPAQAADWREVAELVTLVGPESGVYAAHIRDEADDVIAAINEAIQIAQAGGTQLVISHHKVMGQSNFGRSEETLALIEAAAVLGPIAFDAYPYTAGASMLHEGLVQVARKVILASSASHPELAGQELADIAASMGCTPLEAVKRLSPGTAIYFIMDEADVQRILAHPMAMIGSDGIPGEHPHPRLWGTFPRVLGHYGRELGLFPFEEAVRRMTQLPAQTFGLQDRGVLRAGALADLVLLDRKTVIDRATFEAPKRQSEGIVHVIVNGRFAWRDGASTGLRAGRVLRRRQN